MDKEGHDTKLPTDKSDGDDLRSYVVTHVSRKDLRAVVFAPSADVAKHKGLEVFSLGRDSYIDLRAKRARSFERLVETPPKKCALCGCVLGNDYYLYDDGEGICPECEKKIMEF